MRGRTSSISYWSNPAPLPGHSPLLVFGVLPPIAHESPVEVDETWIGGRDRNRHASKKLGRRRHREAKTAVIGAKDRETKRVSAAVVAEVGGKTPNAFVDRHAAPGTAVYTDGSSAYRGRENHETVRHGAGEFVRGIVHTNGVEPFWSLLKRGYVGTFHYMSVKHLHRYVAEFAGRENAGHDSMACLAAVFRGAQGKRHAGRLDGLLIMYPMMGTCPLVMIEWEDSAQPVPGWAYLVDIEAKRAVVCASVGWLIHDGERVKTLAPNMGALADDSPQVSGVIRIPSRAVIRVTPIDEPSLTSSSVPSSHPAREPIPQGT